MFGGLTANAVAQIQIVQDLIAHHEALQQVMNAGTRHQVKLYAVSSCVTRLYAIFEHFVHSIVADYLDAVPEVQNFDALSEGFRKEYRNGISYLLGRLDSPRYQHLQHENVIRWYHEALSKASPYRFVAEALTHHDENLRLPVVTALFARVQLNDLRGWLVHHSSVLALYTEHTAIYEQLESEFKNFVQLRNDSAHGALSDLLGADALARFCALVRALVEAISSYFHRSLLLLRIEAGKARRVGEVTEVFAQAGAFVAQLSAKASLAQGMCIHLVGNSYCGIRMIESLQINGAPVSGVTAIQDLFEVGIKAGENPRRNVVIYIDS